jgi:hypothetical protein
VKLCYLSGLCFITAIFILAGCASGSSTSAAAKPGEERKGHWEMREPETGSHIARRVWVDENGHTTNAPTMGNIEIGSGAALQQSQTRSSRPPIGQ